MPGVPAPYPLATNIDPTPWGAIDVIYTHPEVDLEQDPELWAAVFYGRQGVTEAGLTIAALDQMSGFLFDVLVTMSGTRSRLLKSEADGST